MGVGGLKVELVVAVAAVATVRVGGTTEGSPEVLLGLFGSGLELMLSVTMESSESDSKITSSSGWTEVKLKMPEPVGDGSFEMVA